MAKSSTAGAIAAGLRAVTKDWAKQRRAEERDAARRFQRDYYFVREPSLKDIAYEVMPQAYMKASGNEKYPANARQVMYAARPLIQPRINKPLDDQYFCQTLLPDYLNEHPELNWDIAYDARGHFIEPHTGRVVDLGTLQVRDYIAKLGRPRLEEAEFSAATIVTCGPTCRFSAVLFIEKEGFSSILWAARIAKRYDIAIMSTKGLSVVAARRLVDHLCGTYHIPLLVLHDLDKSGFSILGTLSNSNRRYEFKHDINVIDLGLRLDDVQAFNLEDQWEGSYDKGDLESRRCNLRFNGATEEEIEILADKRQRIELNAMTSDQLVDFIERKLQANGIKKVVPDKKQLAEAYQMFTRSMLIEEVVDKAIEESDPQDVKVPRDLEKKIREHLKENPEQRWDQAVNIIAGGDAAEDDEGEDIDLNEEDDE